MKELEELKREFEDKKSIIQKLRLKLEEEEKEAIDLLEKIYELDTSMVKVMCFNCGGVGYSKVEGKNKVCEICRGNGYLWMRIWKNETSTKTNTSK